MFVTLIIRILYPIKLKVNSTSVLFVLISVLHLSCLNYDSYDICLKQDPGGVIFWLSGSGSPQRRFPLLAGLNRCQRFFGYFDQAERPISIGFGIIARRQVSEILRRRAWLKRRRFRLQAALWLHQRVKGWRLLQRNAAHLEDTAVFQQPAQKQRPAGWIFNRLSEGRKPRAGEFR